MLLLRIFILLCLFNVENAASVAASTNIQQLLNQENYSEALTEIELRLHDNPNVMPLLFLKAKTLDQVGKNQQSMVVYHKIIRLYPDHPEAYNNLAVLYATQGELQRAKNILQKGLATNPAYFKIYTNINTIFLEMARDSYIKALRLGVKQHTVSLLSFSKIKYSTKNNALSSRSKNPESDIIVKNNEDIISVLHAWAAAWSAQDAKLYLSFYGKQFKPASGFSRQQWIKQRQQRLSHPRWIDVQLSNFTINKQTKNLASVIVTQVYRSNNFRDRSIKKIGLFYTSEGWQILTEKNIKHIN